MMNNYRRLNIDVLALMKILQELEYEFNHISNINIAKNHDFAQDKQAFDGIRDQCISYLIANNLLLMKTAVLPVKDFANVFEHILTDLIKKYLHKQSMARYFWFEDDTPPDKSIA